MGQLVEQMHLSLTVATSKLLANLDDRQRHSTNGFQAASCAASEDVQNNSPCVLRGNDALGPGSRRS